MLTVPNQTFQLLSKSAYADLLARHRFAHNHTVHELRDDSATHLLLLGRQPLNALRVVTQQGSTELWILRNPSYRVICRILRNPLEVNRVLQALKQ